MSTPEHDLAFGEDLLRLLGADNGNLVFSPASIAAALRMVLCGARGQTATEIAAALHLRGPEEAADGLRLLADSVVARPANGTVLRAPNTMWVQAGMSLRPEFLAVLRQAAAVTVRDADFRRAAEAARREINELVAKQTEDKITDLLPPGVVDSDTRLVLVNAIYLKAAWVHRFPEQATGDAPFYPSAGAPVTAKMMHLTEELSYLDGNGYQAVVLPYAGGLAMTIVLPAAKRGPEFPSLTRVLAEVRRGARPHRVTLALPRFRQSSNFELIPVLARLGVKRAFGRDADFSGITGAETPFISAVAHKAFIDTGERGTEAAAATSIVATALAWRPPAPPVTMTVDHPFLFVISDTGTGLPLFLGRVTDPGHAGPGQAEGRT